jgi:hypothetical protein
MPSLVREVKREEDVSPGLEPMWAVQPDDPCKVQGDYFAEGETDLDWSAFAAGFWLSIGTANDRPKMSLYVIVFFPTSTSRSRPAAYFTVSSPAAAYTAPHKLCRPP